MRDDNDGMGSRKKKEKETHFDMRRSFVTATYPHIPPSASAQPAQLHNKRRQAGPDAATVFASTSQPRSPIRGILVESVKRMCVCGLKQACEMRRGGGEEEVKEIDKDSCMEARNVHIQNKYQGQMRSWIRLGKPLSGKGLDNDIESMP
jgi:hypothetical protein